MPMAYRCHHLARIFRQIFASFRRRDGYAPFWAAWSLENVGRIQRMYVDDDNVVVAKARQLNSDMPAPQTATQRCA